MALRTGNDRALRTVCEELPVGADVQGIINEMWEVMYAGKGVGLAANQTGSTVRIIVMHVGEFKKVIINPVIYKAYGGRIISRNEGCLSFPGLRVDIFRHKRVIINGYDENWKPIRKKLKGRAAIGAQHEIDHLNGVTIKDRLIGS